MHNKGRTKIDGETKKFWGICDDTTDQCNIPPRCKLSLKKGQLISEEFFLVFKTANKTTIFLFGVCEVWQYGLWSFQTGGTKLERFLPKNQHTERKLLNFEFWINGELSKSAKI